jgi:GNAT superfamily N-acetyltransferase
VHVDGWRAAYRGEVPDAYLDALDVSDRGRRWRDRLAVVSADPGSAVLVADDEGRLVGFASVGPPEELDAPGVGAPTLANLGEIYAIYVEPDRIGTGVGGALLERAVDVLRRMGCAAGVLWVLPGNARARRFYEAAGWRPDGAETVQRIDGLELPSIRYRSTL